MLCTPMYLYGHMYKWSKTEREGERGREREREREREEGGGFAKILALYTRSQMHFHHCRCAPSGKFNIDIVGLVRGWLYILYMHF